MPPMLLPWDERRVRVLFDRPSPVFVSSVGIFGLSPFSEPWGCSWPSDHSWP